jgi:uncharacterized membrane protein
MTKGRYFLGMQAVICCILLALMTSAVYAQKSEPVVRGVLFYSPNCSHCQAVIQTHLPPIFEKYGSQLEIFGVDVNQPEGLTLYQAAIERFQIPGERVGVPTLIVGSDIMVGDHEIPELLPGLVDKKLAQGGEDWPDIPGLLEVLATPTPLDTQTSTAVPTMDSLVPFTPTVQPAPTATPGIVISENHPESWQGKFFLDPFGNTLSVLVLIGMLGSLLWAVLNILRQNTALPPKPPGWFIPLLCIIGVIVAGYLAFVETTQAVAVCGPVGDCNTVQQSEYAQLFGLVPIGVVGLAGYLFILIAWIFARIGNSTVGFVASLSITVMTLAGTLFSIYLTFLEPFVIGATCIWCLTSSVLVTVIMLLSVKQGKYALDRLIYE